MKVVKWNPFSELDTLHEQLDSVFNDSLMNDVLRYDVRLPKTDMYSDDKHLVMEVELPKFAEEDVHIESEGNDLIVKAGHSETEKDASKKYILQESTSSYYRRFTLPKNADVDAIKAHLKKGVLKVEVPLKELPKPKRIAIDK